MENFFRKIKRNLISDNPEYEKIIRGSNLDQIKDYEKKMKLTLTPLIQEYLKEFGGSKAGNDLFDGTMLLLRSMEEWDQDYIDELVKDEYIRIKIPSNALFIGNYQNCQLWFVVIDETDDPNVYQFTIDYEREDEASCTGLKFSKYVERYLLTGKVG